MSYVFEYLIKVELFGIIFFTHEGNVIRILTRLFEKTYFVLVFT
jgi:hypothetical protein